MPQGEALCPRLVESGQQLDAHVQPMAGCGGRGGFEVLEVRSGKQLKSMVGDGGDRGRFVGGS